MSEYKLTEEIIKLSDADNWDEAKLEWGLEEVYREDEPDTCLCGHNPINEICLIRNSENGNSAIVGNVCVKKFLGLPSDKIFSAIQRITKDEHAAINIETVKHARKKGWINDYEEKFSISTLRKRNLTGKQMNVRVQINQKLLRAIVNSRGSA